MFSIFKKMGQTVCSRFAALSHIAPNEPKSFMGRFIQKSYMRMATGVGLTATAFFTLAMPELAHATTVTQLLQGVNGMGNEVAATMIDGGFLAGLGSVGVGVWKFKVAHQSDGRDAKYSHGLMALAVGAGLMSLPAVTGVGVSTLFAGGTSQAATEGTINMNSD